jgi:hypothetical protein
MQRFLVLFAMGLSALASCGEPDSVDSRQSERPANFRLTEPDEASVTNGKLLTANRMITLSAPEVSQRLQGTGAQAQNGVHIYKLTYRTQTPNGQAIDASGILALPDTGAPQFPLISIQHGTITDKADAPSVSPREGIFEASQGFAAVVPDYLGFGAASSVFHPYLIDQAYVDAGLDMIRATREFAARNDFTFPALFLKGYSEGGYATLAMQKAIETTPALAQEFLTGNFRLLASAPTAGPYSLSLTAIKLLERDAVNPVNLTQVVASYRQWYQDFTTPYDTFLQPQAFGLESADGLARKIEQDLFSGRWSVNQLNARLPTTNEQLIQQDFRQDFTNLELTPQQAFAAPAQDQSGLAPLLARNNLVGDWAPKVPTRLYHCQADEVIPVGIAQATFQVFKSVNPQSPVERRFIPGDQYGHGNCPAIFTPVQWFGEILQQLQQQAAAND